VQGIGVGGSSLPDSGPIAGISLAELQSRLVSRVPLSSDDMSRLAARLPLLRQRYNEQLQRAKILFTDPRLKLASCCSLLLLARAAAAVSQLIYQAIRPVNDAKTALSPPTVAPEVVEEALAWNDRQLGLIAQHLHVLDRVEPQIAWLRTLLVQLESHPRVSSSDWTRLARDVMCDASVSPEVDAALPLPGLDLKSYLAEIGHVRHAEVVSRGIEAAQIVARIAAGRATNGVDPELLTVAALCQDCGLLLSRARTAPKAASFPQQIRALHPSIGAGLVAGLVEYSTELPALLAQHHRRLNEPRITPDLYARTQNRASRLLALIARWLEMTEERESATQETLPDAARLNCAHSAARLAREAFRGDWDRRLAADLLAALGFRAESDSLLEAGRRISAFENRAEPQRRLDSADEHWPQPKLQATTLGLANLGSADLELAKRSREIHHARASAR
jgi:hypothetical protein